MGADIAKEEKRDKTEPWPSSIKRPRRKGRSAKETEKEQPHRQEKTRGRWCPGSQVKTEPSRRK